MRLYKFRIALIALAPALTVLGQQVGDPSAILLQTRERLLGDLARMPRYTCVQTITRNYYRASIQRQGQTCAAMIAAPEPRKPEQLMYSWDRLRLEVAIVNNSNVHSWVGEPRFEEDAFGKVAGRGPLGSGDFGTFLMGILGQGIIRFQSEKTVDGRRRLAYSYEMPLDRSRYNILTNQGWRATAFGGEITLDPETADIAQLTVRTAELPKNSEACQAISEVDYGRTKIHDQMILIPRETRLLMLRHDGTETLNRTSYENCREYSSKSRILAQAPRGLGAAATAEAEPPPSNSIPAGLHFNCRIVTAIDSDTAAAGDPIEGVLRSPLQDKHKAVLAPAGARLRGRLVHFEQRLEPVENFQIGVQWEAVDIAGEDVPLTAVLDQPPKTQIWAGTRLLSHLPQPDASDASADGVGYFVFLEHHLRLKQIDSGWTTILPNAKAK